MKSQFIKDLTIGEAVADLFAIEGAEVLVSGTSTRLAFKLKDRTGSVPCVMWSPTQTAADDALGARYVFVRAEVSAYKGSPQFKVSEIIPYDEPDDPADFVEVSPIPASELISTLNTLIDSVTCPPLNALLDVMIGPDSDLRDGYTHWKAASSHHHAFQHGLLHHSVEVATEVSSDAKRLRLLKFYARPMFRDLMVTVALIHDIGKMEELNGPSSDSGFTVVGSELGHIVLGTAMIERAILSVRANGVEFPEELRYAVLHLLASHHGDFGDIKPQYPEALLLHMADMKSASLFYFGDAKEDVDGKVVVKRQYKLDGKSGTARFAVVGRIENLMDQYGLR